MSKSFVTMIINLPAESVKSIIDIDNPKVNISAQEALQTFQSRKDDERHFRSMNSFMKVSEDYVPEATRNVSIPDEFIIKNHDVVVIYDIKKRPVSSGLENPLRMFKLSVKFYDGTENTFIIPSYVKFYSAHTCSFISVEYVRSRHILLDGAGRYVKALDSEEVVDFKPTDFYSYKVLYEIDDKYIDNKKVLPGICNFYLNNLLCNISYNSFQAQQA